MPYSSARRATADFRPLKLKSSEFLTTGRGKRGSPPMLCSATRWISGPPGKPSPQGARCLVERLACRVVTGAGDQRIVAVSFHQDEVGVSTGGDQTHQRESRRRLWVYPFLKPGCVDMPFQVVQPNEGQFVGERKALGGVNADEQGARKSGAVSNCHSVEFMRSDGCLMEGLPDDRHYSNHMLTRSDFRDDAAVLRVQRCLRCHYIGVDVLAVFNDGGSGFVTRCFDA